MKRNYSLGVLLVFFSSAGALAQDQKIDFLKDELGKAVDVMRSIKAALDPLGLMYPGKIFRSSLEPRA